MTSKDEFLDLLKEEILSLVISYLIIDQQSVQSHKQTTSN